LRIRELTLLGQIPFVFVAVFSLDFIANQESIFQIISILVLTLCFIHWWKIQGHLILNSDDHNPRLLKIPSIIEACYSVIIVAQIFSWSISTTMDKVSNGEVWLWLGPLLAMALMIYSIATKLKYLGALSQLFLGFACLIQIETCLEGHNENPLLALIPMATIMATLLLVKIGVQKLSPLKEQLKKYLSTIQTLYTILFTILVILWVFNYCPDKYQSLVSMILTVTCLQVGAKMFASHKNLAQFLSLSYLVTGFLYLAGELFDNNASILSLLGIFIIMVLQQASKLNKSSLTIPTNAHNYLILATAVAVFVWCTVKVSDTSAGLRTITWAGLAVIYFLAGISLKERWYRLIGLSTLGISLLSLIPIIWDMPTELKIASLFVLGAVFVGLGYIYTRYKDHIKKLL
jgi:hypothetical protein